MRIAPRVAAAAIAGAAVLATSLPSAQAITGGAADGGGHPNVGMLLFYAKDHPDDPEELAYRYRCSGSLVAPNVILTAGHCTYGQVGQTLVYIDSTIAEAPPSNLPRASDDPFDDATGTSPGSEVGFVGDEDSGDGRSYVHGTAYTHPNYSNFTDLNHWNDVGVIVLDSAVEGVTTMPVAPLDYLDDFVQPTLNSTLFTFVGYGTEVRQADEGPRMPMPMSYPLIRRVTDAPGQKLSPQILQVNGNEHDPRGEGGTCFGDSGGPGMHDGMQVTVTSYGYTSNCRYLDGHQRVDIQVVQDWLLPIMGGGTPDDDPLDDPYVKPGKGKGRGADVAGGHASSRANLGAGALASGQANRGAGAGAGAPANAHANRGAGAGSADPANGHASAATHPQS